MRWCRFYLALRALGMSRLEAVCFAGAAREAFNAQRKAQEPEFRIEQGEVNGEPAAFILVDRHLRAEEVPQLLNRAKEQMRQTAAPPTEVVALIERLSPEEEERIKRRFSR